jgi:putative nucleotidyltransferase with HDIG domain
MNQSDQDIRNRLLVARLPAMPQILLKLLGLCQADGAGMAEMAKLVANDAGMTTKVLQVANSAAYHRGGQKVGLVQALGTLGADMIRTLVISESVFQTFNSFPASGTHDLRRFWKHALTTAVIAREVAKAMDYAQTEEAYLAGLLHDVGRLALLSAAPDEYAPIFQADHGDSLCAIEQRSLQIAHTEAGAWLVERWHLDSFMADAILYHHEPAARVENAHPLIRIILLAHQLANHDAALPIAAEAGLLCQIDGDSLLAISQGAATQVSKAASYLGIDLSGVDDWVPPSAITAPAPKTDATQHRLHEEVRNMALLSELAQTFARQKDDAQLLKVVRQNAQILFHLEDTIILLMNGSGQSLIGVSVGEQRQRLAEFSITVAGGGGIAESAMQARVAFLGRQWSLPNLAEEQLLRIFGAECLVCVPMAIGSRCLGVLVAGAPAWLVADLQRRERFLQAFGTQAATALQTASHERGEIDRRIAAVKQDFNDSSRRVLHEVNNPLAIIKNYLGVLDDKLTRHEAVDSEMTVLHEELDRVGSIMNEFVGSAPAAPVARLEINRLVGNVVRLFRESKFLPAGVEIVSKVSPSDCEVQGSSDTLKQILVNLIKNAVEAMPRGGRIEIINSGRVAREGGTFFALCVKDNGPGIPPEQRKRLFSPVQSTKAGANRGIGLSIVHNLVSKLGGKISCVSSASGTAFEICLPPAGTSVQTPKTTTTSMQDRV